MTNRKLLRRDGLQWAAVDEMRSGARLFQDIENNKMWLDVNGEKHPMHGKVFRALAGKDAVRVRAGTDIFATKKEYILSPKFTK